ncbi:Glycoside hydrolase, 38 vacuolar alpha mannosidase [Serendipita sp. 396]|nr:Glycoside hydrolase, 38 vacuolar alpha mannosidase [Serendipita sp. 396]KAG8838662.1 Glycoside hydrolase, 38 vacuolar alpha mannosidase [Serendipita sp. 400]KAG8860246.1 Glycoside hydrolase, 38 vacuolar alpha mannosidase [Serendipita sp. 411]KAG8874363.1 Glycoside hydrolase, 38 vacuolar alpha mannosidase [Serendipita sp. 405]
MSSHKRFTSSVPPTRHSYPEDGSSAGKKWIKSLYNDRTGQFVGGRYGDLNLGAVLFTERLDNKEHVELKVWSAPGRTKPSFDEAMRNEFKSAKKGDSFGPSWTNHWWKITLHIPTSWTKYERVQFEFDPGCEAMVFDLHGTPLQGITGGYGGERRVDHIIPPTAIKAGIYQIVVESSCNGLFGISGIDAPDPNRYFSLASADLVVPNQEAWRLMWDYSTLRQISDNLPGNSPTQNQALVLQNRIMNTFRVDDPSTIQKCRDIANELLGEGWEAKGADIYDKNVDALIYGIGYCHIDTAWLWPYSVTQQKVARSWSTQVDLMNRFPEHRFACSSAQQFKWLEQLYPTGFANVKAMVQKGQFHPIGGAWVEHDGNMPSGEAMVRQCLLGQRYFRSRFGITCTTAWLPDSFGLSGAIPQILRLSGMKNFFTQKLSWNNINVFPHTTFNWTGIDGTQVLCHMTPVDTYNAQATFGDVRRGITNHKNLESSNGALLVFGNGDGGGGPLSTMLESLRRIRAAANQSPEVPVVHMGTSVEDFFADIERDTNYGETLPTWHGELYLEFHRGTYTSHGSIKKGNRKSEILLREVEYVSTLASLHASKDYEYPYDRITECWEKVCLNQFHDVLPGSAIGMVYEDAEKLYSEVAKEGRKLFKEAVSAYLGGFIPLMSLIQDQKPFPSGRLVALNTVHATRREIIEVPLLGPSSVNLKSQVVQISRDGSKAFALMDSDDNAGGILLAKGIYADIKPVTATKGPENEFILTNANVSMTVKEGRITSLYDMILQRELLIKGMTGGLVIFDDRPNYWDAWDIEIFHLESREPLVFSKVSIVETGPVRASLRAELKLPKSTVSVLISLDAVPATLQSDSRSMIRFDAEVDWHERHRLLKFELPLNIRAHEAIYETQFGHISRPTHKNTTWDIAKFEVCCHKYCDVSEYGYGVAIINDCKYGASADGQFMRLSLLRAATAPDAEQDQGKHEFAWAILPHVGHFLQSDVPIAAQFFNTPLHVMLAPESGLRHLAINTTNKSPFSIEEAPNVILETVKRAEDDPHKKLTRVVLRIFEAYGGHASATLRVASHLTVDRAYICNLLEEKISGLELTTHEATGDTLIKLSLHAFQILTVRLTITSVKSPTNRRFSEEWVSI